MVLGILLGFQGCAGGGSAKTTVGDASAPGGCVAIWGICIQAGPNPPRTSTNRFKVEVSEFSFLEHDQQEGLVYGQVKLRIIPTLLSDKESVTIFLGRLSLYDIRSKNPKKLAYQRFEFQDKDGLDNFVLAGGQKNDGYPLYWQGQYPDSVKILGLQWEFFQREHNSGMHCEVIISPQQYIYGARALSSFRQYAMRLILANDASTLSIPFRPLTDREQNLWFPYVRGVDRLGNQSASYCYNDADLVAFRAPHLDFLNKHGQL